MSIPADQKQREFESEALVHLDALYGLALRLSGGDEPRAEDLVQEAVLKAYRAWDRFEAGTNCRAWLMTILRNTFINQFRQQKTRPTPVEFEQVAERPSSDAMYEADPEGEIFDRITLHPDVAVNTGGEIAWAFRKESPELEGIVNEFVKGNRKGTLMGNMFYTRYLKDNKWARNATSPEELKKFNQTVAIFKKYADQYGFDFLMTAALAYQESTLDHSKRSGAGAMGSPADELGLADCLEGEAERTLLLDLPGGSGRWEVRRGTYRHLGRPRTLVLLSDVSRTLRADELER